MNNRIPNEHRGFILVSSLVLLVTLTLVAVVFAYRNSLEELMAANQRDAVQAMVAAETGIESGWSWTQKKHEGLTQWHDDFNTKISDQQFEPIKGYVGAPDSVKTLDNVQVMRSVDEDGDAVIIMRSVGYAGPRNSAERVLEVVMEMQDLENNSSSSRYAILTNDTMDKMSGTITVRGSHAHVHSNQDFISAGDPVTIGGNASAVGRVIEDGGTLIVHGDIENKADEVVIPVIDPRVYRPYATVVLTEKCKYEDPAGNDVSNNTLKNQWTCDKGNWEFSNQPKNGYEAFYYVEGNLTINGGAQNDWCASFVAEGTIKVSGSGSNFRTWGNKEHCGNETGNAVANEILFYAGNDIELSGEDDSDTWGIIATHREMKINGNWTLKGTIIAENGKSNLSWNIRGDSITDKNEFSGNWSIISEGSVIYDNEQGKVQKLVVTAWRELVEA